MDMDKDKLVKVRAKSVYEYIKTKFPREITTAMGTASEFLLGKWNYARLYERCKRDELLEVPLDALYRLADQWNVADKEKFAGALIVSKQEKWTLPRGDASQGEIEVTQWSENILNDPKYAPVNKYVAVYVDDVRFRQRDEETGRVVVKEGKYIRIEVPSGLPGAIVLPVDSETGDVLLVTQYRHPQRRFLTEAPRGFGMLGVDRQTIDTARREMAEEAGAIPLKNIRGVEEIYHLRALYTDTGKLAEAPYYYLAFVNRKLQLENLNRREPTMEDPVWISLPVFYRAIYQEDPIELERGDYEFCLKEEYREKLNAKTPLDDGLLQIEDAFTVLVALLAQPRLKQRFSHLFKEI